MALTALLMVVQYIVLLLMVSVHDAAQAWAAFRLGDPSGEQTGRISLNPAQHWELFGMLVFPLISFYLGGLPLGWGRPVPMMYRNFRSKNGEVLAVLAGPAAQLATALVLLILFLIVKHTVPGAAHLIAPVTMVSFRFPLNGLAALPAYFPLLVVMFYGMELGLLLAVFNLLPVPFLDGGKVLSYWLPYNAAQKFNAASNWIMIAFFFLGGYAINLFFTPLMGLFTGLLFHL